MIVDLMRLIEIEIHFFTFGLLNRLNILCALAVQCSFGNAFLLFHHKNGNILPKGRSIV